MPLWLRRFLWRDQSLEVFASSVYGVKCLEKSTIKRIARSFCTNGLSFKNFLYFFPSFFIIWLVSFEMSWKGFWFFGSFCGSQRKKKDTTILMRICKCQEITVSFIWRKNFFSFPIYPFKIKKEEKKQLPITPRTNPNKLLIQVLKLSIYTLSYILDITFYIILTVSATVAPCGKKWGKRLNW